MAISIEALTLGVNTFGFLLLAWQARLLKEQIETGRHAEIRDRALRRRQATLEFSTATLEKQDRWKSELPHELDEKALAEYTSEPENTSSTHRNRNIQEFLGFFEELATGANIGVYDITVIYYLMGLRITRAMSNYKAWIEERRRLFDHPSLYKELEILAHKIDQLRALEGSGDLPSRDEMADPDSYKGTF